eukprot:3170800-Amphidinium_carterae.1
MDTRSSEYRYLYLETQCGKVPLSGSAWAQDPACEWPTCRRTELPSETHCEAARQLLARGVTMCEQSTAGGQWKYTKTRTALKVEKGPREVRDTSRTIIIISVSCGWEEVLVGAE